MSVRVTAVHKLWVCLETCVLTQAAETQLDSASLCSHVTDGSDCDSAARIKGQKKGLNTRLIDWWQKFTKAASVSFFCNVILRFIVDLPIVQPVVQKKEF